MKGSVAQVPPAVDLPATGALLERGLGVVFTAASLQVRADGQVVCRRALGYHAPAGSEISSASIFDLASLTKLFVVTALLALFDRRAFALDDPIVTVIPEFAGPDGRRATVSFRNLLTHTSGLPAHVNFREESSYEAVMARVCATPLAHAPGQTVVYSDLGFMIAGETVARLSGKSLPAAIEQFVGQPLSLTSLGYRPPARLRDRIVVTEDDPRRGGLLRGDVHDENCWAMGGIAGHAGLFGTADDVAALGEMYRLGGAYGGGRQLLRPTALAAIREHARSADERRGLGWALKSGDGQSSGSRLSPDSFGHTGYTGTSIWVDPTRALTIVLLTNRVHLTRDPDPIRLIRAAVADSVVDELSSLLPHG